jgi:hypothetical protein
MTGETLLVVRENNFGEALIPQTAFFKLPPEVFDPAPDGIEIMKIRVTGETFGVCYFEIADMVLDLHTCHLANIHLHFCKNFSYEATNRIPEKWMWVKWWLLIEPIIFRFGRILTWNTENIRLF